jgi:alpha-galactosidase
MQLQPFSKRAIAGILTCLLLLCAPFNVLYAQTRQQQQKVLTMRSGRGITMVYALQQGTYDVIVNGKTILKDISAACEAGQHYTSTGMPFIKYTVQPLSDGYGTGKRVILDRAYNGVRMQQLFYFYAHQPFFFVQVKMIGPSIASSWISPLNNTTINMEQAEHLRGLSVPFDNDMWVRYEVQPLTKANYTSSEVTTLFNNETRRGLVIGSVEHTTWKSAIRVRYENNRITLAAFGGFADSVATHDKIPHGKVADNDSVCQSPKMMVGFFDDWRKGMEQYAEANRLAEPPVIFKWKKATPMGWNSWGALQTKLNGQNAKAVVDFLYDSCKGFRNADSTLYINLDSYWDNLIKGGIGGDVSELEAFATYCKSKKFKPGIYWAPFADWGKHGQKIEGTGYSYTAAWLRQKGHPVDLDGAYAMDPTHPGTKERIVRYITRFKELGFDMIKIDFLGHAALESDRFYDPAVTTGMQAYAAGMQFLDSVLNGTMLVYAAISPTMATGRYVHMRRIACDAFSAIDNTEYTLNSTGYGWWQSHLYTYADADHVVFKNETAGANRARLASALVTGTLITGDDFSTAGPWTHAARQWLQNKALLQLVSDGRPFRPLRAVEGKKAPQLFIKTMNGKTYLAAFNYENTACTVNLSLPDLGFAKGANMINKELFSQQQMPVTNTVTIQIPASDVKLYEIRTSRKQ